MTGDTTHQPLVEAALLERAAADSHRPRFHFTAPAGWLNDPNGLTRRGDEYHLFYQFNPLAPVHDRIHWGHAVSTDLVRWRDLPIALAPSDGPDVDGCWSGVLVDDGDVPTIVYSGRHGEHELPCIATGSDDLVTWTKHPGNPVIPAPPADLDIVAFRDHCVWREDGLWRQIIGSGIRGRGGTALLYESADLREWRYLGPLVVGDSDDRPRTAPDWTGTMWECVDLFRMEDGEARSDILVFSAWDEGVTHHPLYWTGHYEGDRYVPDRLHRLDLGGRFFYAPQSMSDAEGRRIVFGWMQEGREDAASIAAGWSGVMSLPRAATLAADGSLRQAPVEEVASLRDALLFDGAADGARFEGDQVDLELDVELRPGATVEIVVRATADGQERTVYRIERTDERAARLSLDRSRSSIDPTVDVAALSGDVPFDGDRLHVRLLIDHSALEMFAGGVPLAARIYPTRADAAGIAVTTGGAAGTVRAWRMRAAGVHR
ncbi:glycoside hydrolase family 32 protein [Microbacterium sp. T2.11-28]|uniref:glycoside hydrolase family 32 protein n=1 Tax=Microbacterium sp. T2.11-28 TaxID=3041169 RepID=UPI002477C7C8|nr:glycoside hydrolase family 32 protein [Microbacterium sp. T2.11-28]CAI9393370.1 Sucrose-6-phosphate hydrolase [Microbacterium sp. T2.11-28]